MDLVPNRIVVGISGASGAIYAQRVIELLTEADVHVHVTLTSLGRRLLFDELDLRRPDPDALSGGRGDRVTLHADNDVGATIASGSFLHRGMVVVPASSNSLGAIANGITSNLLQRAAAVTLKERRPLIIAHRESPLSLIDIENMRRVTEAGAVVAPLVPGFYLRPKRLEEIVDFMAGRLLDLLGVPHTLDTRWEDHLLAERDEG